MAEAVHDAKRLAELQVLPLERKIQISQARIIEWYNHWKGNVVVSFSGGKDSTVLLHMVRRLFPDVRAVFSNTGLEYPEIQRHVMGIDNVDIVRPKMRFDEVISTYGYPLIGKEVAEAIYYARKLRSQNCNVERERERERMDRRPETNGDARGQTNRPEAARERERDVQGQTCASQDPRQTHPLIQTSIARNRRTVLSGKMDFPETQEDPPG